MPKSVDPDARRHEIAAAVRRLLARDAVDAVTMRNVASELGSTTGLLTHWVENRAALIHLALMVTANEQTDRAVAVLMRRPSDVVGAMEPFIPLDEPRLAEMKVWIGFWALAIGHPTLAAEQRTRYRDFRTRLTDHLRGLGVRPAARALAIADTLTTAVNGLAVAASFDREHWTAARQRRHLRAVVDRALPELSEPSNAVSL